MSTLKVETLSESGLKKQQVRSVLHTQLHAAAVNGDKSALARLASAFPKFIDSGEQFLRTPLIYCALADRVECAELLLKHGAVVDKKDIGGRTALHWACHKGNFRLMKLLISKGADIREKDNEGCTCLHLCTRHKSSKCIGFLIKYLSPGEIDNQDLNKRTALHWAASYGNYEHVKMLINKGSNIGIPDSEGKTPLHWAASSIRGDSVECVFILLKTTPSVINWQDYEGRTALHLSVADGNREVVDVLTSIDNSTVSALDNMFRTVLHWAAALSRTEIVELLLDRTADPSSSDANGATCLHYAAQNNNHETMEVLLNRESVIDKPDLDGRSAFIWAASKGADDVINIFLNHGVDIHQVDNNGASALHAAALSGHASSVKILIDSNALIDASDHSKHTPLFRACEMGHTDVVLVLVENGARVDLYDLDGHSPLHWAALGGHSYICQLLIKYGLDTEIRDHAGHVPLHCAAFGGYVSCMSVLLEHGAAADTQDNEGMTALHWGCARGHLDAVKLLAEYYCVYTNTMVFSEDRYTPLDYALMGEHHDVAQYMIETGALSITAIQDIAALKIQATFRGYRLRKTFLASKRLLMKHEQLKRAAIQRKTTLKHEIFVNKDSSSVRTPTMTSDIKFTRASKPDGEISPTNDTALITTDVKTDSNSNLCSENLSQSLQKLSVDNCVDAKQQTGDCLSYDLHAATNTSLILSPNELPGESKISSHFQSLYTTCTPENRRNRSRSKSKQDANINNKKTKDSRRSLKRNVYLKDSKQREQAALVLQKAWERYKNRRKRCMHKVVRTKRKKAEKVKKQHNIDDLSNNAAKVIQRVWRSHRHKLLSGSKRQFSRESTSKILLKNEVIVDECGFTQICPDLGSSFHSDRKSHKNLSVQLSTKSVFQNIRIVDDDFTRFSYNLYKP